MFTEACICKIPATHNADRVRKLLFSYLLSLGYEIESGYSEGKLIAAMENKRGPQVQFFDDNLREKYPELYKDTGYIDCGENVALFKAIASIADNTDRNQFFTDGHDWIVCPFDKFSEFPNTGGFHKATVTELFNKRWHSWAVIGR